MIYDKASLVQIPSGYKASSAKLYSVIPSDGDGDFTVSADADATRINAEGLVETTSANQARLSRNFIDGELQPDPFLLLEPTRQNYAAYSAQFDNSYWTKATSDSTPNPTVTANAAISPDGGLNADRVQSTAAPNNSWSVVKREGINTGATVGSKLQQSLYLKAYDSSQVGKNVDIYIYDFSNSAYLTVYNYTLTSDWQRVVVEHTITGSNTSTNIEFSFGKARNTVGGSLQSETATDFLVWGAQLETGTYASSYIPTTTAAVTRTKDTVKLENFTDMPTDYPFTAFVDMDVIEDEKGYGFSILDISSSANYFSLGYSEDGGTLGKFRFTNRAQGTSYNFNTTSTYGTGRYKIAVKFISATNFKAFIDGVEVADYTHTSSAFNTNINDVLLGQLRVSGDVNTRNTVYQFMLFNEALSDSELETLTSYTSFNKMAKALLYTIE